MERVSKSEESITPIGNGAFRITRGDGSHAVAYGVVDGSKTWVFVDGITHVIEPVRRKSAGSGADAAALAAPMPATVAQIHVTVGQVVAPTELLMTLEAMKMELPIRATAGGTVTAINCHVGELVQAGVPLLEIRDGGLTGTRNAERETQNAERGTQNLKRGTWNANPEPNLNTN